MQKVTPQEWLYGTCILLVLCFFGYFDLRLQGVIDVSIAYVSLPGLGLLARSRRLVAAAGLLGVLATIIGYLHIPDLAGVTVEGVNRNLSAVSITTITVICLIYMYRQLEFEQKILRMSSTDELTGIYNRRALMQELGGRINESKRHDTLLSLILFDIDDFKLINDRFGHAAGDDILVRLTNICQKWLRSSDSIGRYGGEEFLVVCPSTSLDGARILAARISRAIEETGFFYRKHHLHVTISCGITELHNHLQQVDGQNEVELAHDMIDAADSAMYQAKKSGKNAIVAYEPETNADTLDSLQREAS